MNASRMSVSMGYHPCTRMVILGRKTLHHTWVYSGTMKELTFACARQTFFIVAFVLRLGAPFYLLANFALRKNLSLAFIFA